jgi:hypothetical protein
MHLKLLLLMTLASLVLTVSSRKLKGKYEAGQPFPKPQSISQTNVLHYLEARAFAFQYAPGSVVCDLLSNAFNRYYKIIFNSNQHATRISDKKYRKTRQVGSIPADASILKRVTVNIHSPCEDYPSLESDESCNVSIPLFKCIQL